MQKINIVDSHTGGEPTRVVISGFPDLGSGSITDKLEVFKSDYDHLRAAIVKEPRGNNAIVGALSCEPSDENCVAAVIFFNNSGFLNMCGHGTIGLIKTLEHLGKIGIGAHKIETPVGIISVELDGDGFVTFENVASYRFRKDVEIDVEEYGHIVGDVAWGGNWFFLTKAPSLELHLDNLQQLTAFTSSVKRALSNRSVTGKDDEEIDHIEIFSESKVADSRNFVLCPGGEYDRSPCGTGTSAKLACLYEDGKIKAGEIWKQESIIGSTFDGSVKIVDGEIIPIICGTSYITATSELVFDGNDPFRFGVN